MVADTPAVSALTIAAVGDGLREGILLDAIRARGWTVRVVSPGDLVSTVALWPPSAVVLDERGQGHATLFALAEQVRRGSAVPVIVLTSLRTSHAAKAARAAGCVCITTPCRATTVIAGVTSAVALAGGDRWRTMRRSQSS